ncbi:MAG: Zn-dependent hydrolase [Thermodesulfobacteriota bacterium]
MKVEINLARLRDDLETLSRFGRRAGGGVTRLPFSQADRRARDWLAGRMAEAGLKVRRDAAGNLWGRLDGDGPTVMAGSHLDTVPEGGMFDGALGVLGALECLRTIREKTLSHRRPLEMVAFVDEEGAFYSFLGSRACLGLADPEELAGAADLAGRPLAVAMAEAGLDLARLPEAQRDPADIGAYLELHIEQGPVLESEGASIGIVGSIVGIVNYWLTFTGQAAHAGTTPPALRRDALLGAAEFALKVEDLVQPHGRGVATVGDIKVAPGAFNIVPREARLAFEFRDASPGRLEEMEREFLELGHNIARRRDLNFLPRLISRDEPVQLSEEVGRMLQEEAEALGLAWRSLDSGAGHDAQVLARRTSVGLIFLPSLGGVSHCPEEYSRWPDVEKGTLLLLRGLLRLAGQEKGDI